MTLETSTVRPGNEIAINPTGKFVLAHNGAEWNESFLAAVQFTLTRELEDEPITIDILAVDTLASAHHLETLNITGMLTAITPETLTFYDGKTVPMSELLAVWY